MNPIPSAAKLASAAAVMHPSPSVDGQKIRPDNEGRNVSPIPYAKSYRQPIGLRFDLLEPEFLEAMAMIMSVGAKKYGEAKWKQGLSGESGGINHAFKHLCEYQQDAPCEYGPREVHLAQVAVNAMFEFHFARKRRLVETTTFRTKVIEDMKKMAEALITPPCNDVGNGFEEIPPDCPMPE